MILEGDCFDRLKELDIFMDDYFFDHHPISKENARKRLQSLLKQAELRARIKEIKVADMTGGNYYKTNRITELESELKEVKT